MVRHRPHYMLIVQKGVMKPKKKTDGSRGTDGGVVG